MNLVELSWYQLGFATLLILINGGLSVWLKLGLEKKMLVASIRMIVQLWIIGLVLEWVFSVERWYIVGGLALFMTVVAGVTAAAQRPKFTFPGMTLCSLISIGASSWLMTAYAIVVVMGRRDDWLNPQFVIPILGMVLGNMLNGIALGMESYLTSLRSKRMEVENLLALGATRWEASHAQLRDSLRVAMIPILNSMLVVGLVSLPGMMTGQMLAGAPPAQAVSYQVMIMFLIAASTALAAATAILLTFRKLFSADHCLLIDLLHDREKKK